MILKQYFRQTFYHQMASLACRKILDASVIPNLLASSFFFIKGEILYLLNSYFFFHLLLLH